MMTLCWLFFFFTTNLDFEVLHLVKLYVLAWFLPPAHLNWSEFFIEMLHCMMTFVPKDGKSIELLNF